MPDADKKTNLVKLAFVVKGTTPTTDEILAIWAKADTRLLSNRASVELVLAESFGESTASVTQKLANNADTDRLIDEIVTGLKK